MTTPADTGRITIRGIDRDLLKLAHLWAVENNLPLGRAVNLALEAAFAEPQGENRK